VDQVGICNLALGWLGAQKITSIGDASVNAELCAANWDATRDAVLEARAWTFAVKRVQVAADATPPAYGWGARFLLPTDCIRVLEAGDGTTASDIEWQREEGYLVTDQASTLYVKYLARIEDTVQWTAGFVQAMAYRLAFALAMPITENAGLQSALWALYAKVLQDAGARDGMQGRSEKRPESTLTYRRF